MAGLYAVIPAAGIGARMKADRPKQYLELAGKTILEHTLEKLIAFPLLEKIVVAISPDDEYWPDIELKNHPKIESCEGGLERYDSVLNGLKHLTCLGVKGDNWVMVHDAARPCISHVDLKKLYQSANDQGSLLGLQVRDTMKRTDTNGQILSTVDRDNLWHALTPQLATLDTLSSAISKALDDEIKITDEASALEYAGLSPKMVAGDPSNIKVTRPDDLELAEAYLVNEFKEHKYV